MKTSVLANPTIFLVRHGQTEMNKGAQKEFRGWLDPKLDATGIKQANEAGDKVAQFPIAHIYAGDLTRTQQTAHAIAQKTGAAVTTTPTLRPWQYGEFTGMPINDDSLAALKHFQDNPDMKVPKGESYSDFIGRYSKPVQAARQYVEQNPTQALVLVTHSRNLYPLRTMLGENVEPPIKETPSKETGMPGPESTGSVWAVEFLPTGQHQISEVKARSTKLEAPLGPQP